MPYIVKNHPVVNENVFEIINSWWNLDENGTDFVSMTGPTVGLAPLCVRTSAGAVVI